jgi:Ca2+-binding EF-hand superfamily protein
MLLAALIAHAQSAAPTQEGVLDEQQCFERCDRNADGWVSFSEAREALSVDRGEFRVYDRDRDGRIDRDEFGLRYRETLERQGAFPPPKAPEKSTALPPKRSATQLRVAYDKDGDGAIDALEAHACLVDYGIAELAQVPLFRKLDVDADARLVGAEIDALAGALTLILAPGLQPALPPLEKTIHELFGKVVERERAVGAPAEPPLIAGPLPAFLRLDIDRDGAITTADVARLQQHQPLALRATSVLAALDRNGDGRVDEPEFEFALRF